jgi:hypothetical protein
MMTEDGPGVSAGRIGRVSRRDGGSTDFRDFSCFFVATAAYLPVEIRCSSVPAGRGYHDPRTNGTYVLQPSQATRPGVTGGLGLVYTVAQCACRPAVASGGIQSQRPVVSILLALGRDTRDGGEMTAVAEKMCRTTRLTHLDSNPATSFRSPPA